MSFSFYSTMLSGMCNFCTYHFFIKFSFLKDVADMGSVAIMVLPLFSLVGPIFVGPKYKKKPNSVYIFVFTTNQIYSTWN